MRVKKLISVSTSTVVANVYHGKALMTDERGHKILIISNTPLHQLIPLSPLIQRAPTVFARHPLRAITPLEPLVPPQAQPLLRRYLLRVVARVLRCMAVTEDTQAWGWGFW